MQLTLEDILRPTIEIADSGFPVSQITAHYWKQGEQHLFTSSRLLLIHLLTVSLRGLPEVETQLGSLGIVSLRSGERYNFIPQVPGKLAFDGRG